MFQQEEYQRVVDGDESINGVIDDFSSGGHPLFLNC
jgi:hypothetical protein